MDDQKPRKNCQQRPSELPEGFVSPPLSLPLEACGVYRHANNFGDPTSQEAFKHFIAALDKQCPEVRQALTSRVQPYFDQACDKKRDTVRDASSLEDLASRSSAHMALANSLRKWSEYFHLNTPVIHQLALRTMANTHDVKLLVSRWSEIQHDALLGEDSLSPDQVAEQFAFPSKAQIEILRGKLVGWGNQRDIPLGLVICFLDHVVVHGPETVEKMVAASWGSLPLTIRIEDKVFEFSTLDWLPHESRAAAKHRITTSFAEALESRLNKEEECRKSGAMEKSHIPANLDSYCDWLVRFQVCGKTFFAFLSEARPCR